MIFTKNDIARLLKRKLLSKPLLRRNITTDYFLCKKHKNLFLVFYRKAIDFFYYLGSTHTRKILVSSLAVHAIFGVSFGAGLEGRDGVSVSGW